MDTDKKVKITALLLALLSIFAAILVAPTQILWVTSMWSGRDLVDYFILALWLVFLITTFVAGIWALVMAIKHKIPIWLKALSVLGMVIVLLFELWPFL